MRGFIPGCRWKHKLYGIGLRKRFKPKTSQKTKNHYRFMPGHYWCKKCEKSHRYTSGIGKEHLIYRR
jgi:ribosomal protein L44E